MVQENLITKDAKSIDEDEILRFAALAGEWWQSDGPFSALHALNVPRLTYIRDQLCQYHGRDIAGAKPLAGLRILDIGCGGGLIAEPLTRLGGEITAIDAGKETIAAAQLHAEQSGLSINYRQISAEKLAEEKDRFDCVLTLEVVEHVADLDGFLAASAMLVRPGGMYIAATINRTTASFALAIVAAERILRWLPPGTHRWAKFVRPSELVGPLRQNGVVMRDISGIRYDPLARTWSLGGSLSINYIACGQKPKK
tara:strand:+ start:2412 stop:3176 length:765 start_codon:yes stop_codon:yes gene_type:complete